MPIPRLSDDAIVSRLKNGDIRIGVVGLGRIGLPTAVLFAEAGANVLGSDISQEVVHRVNNGACHLVDEPGLPETLAKVVSQGKLRATVDNSEVAKNADVVVICVPTPVNESKTPNYSAIVSTSNDVGKSIQRGCIVAIESTVGPGIVESLVIPILEERSGLRCGKDFGVVSCPERSDPGGLIRDMKKVPKVIGGSDPASTDAIGSPYRGAFGVEVVKVSDPKTANAVKLTENLFRDVNIALANEFALLYEQLGIDTIEVIKACSTKYNFMPHYPSRGVGGPCLPANPYYLITEGTKVGEIPYLVRMAREINDRMPDHVVQLILEALNELGITAKSTRIAILGVSYKPDVRDIQNTPIERICRKLQRMGAVVSIYDPYYKGEKVFDVTVSERIEDALRNVACVLIGTGHKEFREMDIRTLLTQSGHRIALIDSVNMVPPQIAIRAGLVYRGVGRKTLYSENLVLTEVHG